MEIKVKPWVRFFANYMVPKKNTVLVEKQYYREVFLDLLQATINEDEDRRPSDIKRLIRK